MGGALTRMLGLGGSAPWQAATLPNLNVTSGGWSNFTLRQRIESSLIPAAFTQVRFSLKGDSPEGFTVTKAYIGIKGTGNFDFASAPTQVFWNGGSASVTSAALQTIMSDTVNLTRTAGQSIMISIFTASGNTANDSYRFFQVASVQAYDAAFKAGDDSTTLVASGYTDNAGQYQLYLDDFEVR